ncbi:hypothetical protein DFH06DRAFT_597948 [Mycena polygramma]|nr:hypothetical protein DFH06DRAFT_737250 [Mycena polygramma]KAJ7643350.1 hypothetical protein DFH06DRAFT_597948 [Mycena polygramma]
MFTSIVFTAVVASSAVLLSHAIVTPNEPGPGEVFNQGTTCHIGWAGDDSGTDDWKGMAIELMTGPNEAMIHVTTVAQNQDGSVAGTFDYTCPEVTPNSPIYFYQFSSGGTADLTWTGRFTIAGADGSSTPATETETGSDGTPVLWGKGALTDPSTAVAAPNFNSTSGSSASGGASASGGSSASASVPVLPSSSAPTASSAAPASGAATRAASTAKSSTPASSGSSSAPQTSGSSAAVALGPMVMDTRMWPFAAALTACAMAFTILL